MEKLNQIIEGLASSASMVMAFRVLSQLSASTQLIELLLLVMSLTNCLLGKVKFGANLGYAY